MASYGNGWGSNIVATVGTASSAILTPDGKLETMPAWNLGTGISINLLQNLETNLNINWFGIEPSEYRAKNKMKSGASAHINFIWAPIKSVNTGIEYMILRRTNVDSNSGTGQRLQLMIKYIF
jgi:hypothetical protein